VRSKKKKNEEEEDDDDVVTEAADERNWKPRCVCGEEVERKKNI